MKNNKKIYFKIIYFKKLINYNLESYSILINNEFFKNEIKNLK